MFCLLDIYLLLYYIIYVKPFSDTYICPKVYIHEVFCNLYFNQLFGAQRKIDTILNIPINYNDIKSFSHKSKNNSVSVLNFFFLITKYIYRNIYSFDKI